MQRYPFWKGALLSAMLLAAVLLALPNYYGESPALQLSQRDRGAFDAAAGGRFEGLLRAAKIDFEESYVDDDGRLWIRFGDEHDQLLARDLIQREHEGEYAIAMTSASRAPDWLNSLGLEPMSLGLDLRGGMLLVYEVDIEGAVAQLLQRMERDFRKELRDARIQYEDVAVTGTTTQVRLRDAAETEKARKYAHLRPQPGHGLEYTMGNIQMFNLLADVKRQKGEKLVLKEFHDELMTKGQIPLALIRNEMTGYDKDVQRFWNRAPLKQALAGGK